MMRMITIDVSNDNVSHFKKILRYFLRGQPCGGSAAATNAL